MHGLDVLERVERPVDVALVDLPRQRTQDEDPRHAGIGVELSHDRERLRLLRVGGEPLADVPAAELLGEAPHAPLVCLGCVLVSDQHRRQARCHTRPLQLGRVGLDLRAQLGGESISVDQMGGHRLARLVHFRVCHLLLRRRSEPAATGHACRSEARFGRWLRWPGGDPRLLFGADEIERARAYHRPLYLAWPVGLAVDLGLLAAIAFSGLGEALFDPLEGLPWWAQTLGFTAIVICLTTLATLPLSLWAGFLRERAWGFSTQSAGGWVVDRAKGLCVGLVLGGAALLGLVALARCAAARVAPRSRRRCGSARRRPRASSLP